MSDPCISLAGPGTLDSDTTGFSSTGGPPGGRGDGSRVGGVLVKVPGREFLFSDTEFLRVEYNTVKR